MFGLDIPAAEAPQNQILLVQENQLIQISQERDDGWAYGTVVYTPETPEVGVCMQFVCILPVSNCIAPKGFRQGQRR